MFRVTKLLATLVALTTLCGCTRTIYVIQDPDGKYREVDPDQYKTPPQLVHKHPHHVVKHEPIVSDDGMIIELLTSTEYLLVDGSHPLYVQLTIEGKAGAVEVRAPMNLAIVIDRSGSMRGEKLRHAIDAAQQLVDRLSDGDRVSVVSYGSDVRVDVPSTMINHSNRRWIQHAITRLRSGGQTFLSGGLETAASQVSRTFDEDAVNRVILLSDGRANVGVSSVLGLDRIAGRLYHQGISITTMGVGLDYNEDVMCAVAVAGGGNYYFIEHSRDMARIFETELNTLTHLVGQDTILYLELPPDVTVQEVYGYKFEKRGRELRVHLNSVSAGQKRRVIMALKVPPGREGATVVTRGRVEYRSTKAKARKTVQLNPVTVFYTADRSRVARSLNRPVMEKLEMVRNARARQAAMARLDAGDKAGASQIVRRRLKAARKVHRAIGGVVLANESKAMESLDIEVQAAPAAATPAYRRMRKTNLKSAYDSTRH